MTWTLELLRVESAQMLIETMSAPQVQSLLELPLLSLRQLARHSSKRKRDEFATPQKTGLLDLEPTFGASLLTIHNQYTAGFLQLLK